MHVRAARRLATTLALAAGLAGASTSALAAPAQPVTPAAAVSALESGVLTDINALRQSYGLAPLRLSAELTAAARQHSASMAAMGYFGHDSADGSPFWKRLRRYYGSTRYGYWSVGENLLWSAPDVDPAGALQMWLASPEHRANLLTARWREIGIAAVHVDAAGGIYGDEPVTVVTTDFGVRR
jgi:uncharacterized protein YkwD